MRCPEVVRMFTEVFCNYDSNGDGTWPLRQVRDIHITMVRAVVKTHKCHEKEAAKLSLCCFLRAGNAQRY